MRRVVETYDLCQSIQSIRVFLVICSTRQDRGSWNSTFCM